MESTTARRTIVSTTSISSLKGYQLHYYDTGSQLAFRLTNGSDYLFPTSDDPFVPAYLVLPCRENLHQVATVELAVQVRVTVPCVLQLLDPDPMVLLVNQGVGIQVEHVVLPRRLRDANFQC